MRYILIFFGIFFLFTSHQVNAQAIGTIGFSQQIVGNVGIGSTNPGQLLDVQGTVRALSFIGPISSPYIQVTNSQASGTNGGSTTSGSWQTAVLNTINFDTSSIATLSSNAISLPAGTYQVRALMPIANNVSANVSSLRLYNSTNSSVILYGHSGYIGADSPNMEAWAFVQGQFTLSSTQSINLQYYVSTAYPTVGQGVAVSQGTEVYATVELWKIQ